MIERDINNYTKEEREIIDRLTDELTDDLNYPEKMESDTMQRVISLHMARELNKMTRINQRLIASVEEFTGVKI